LTISVFNIAETSSKKSELSVIVPTKKSHQLKLMALKFSKFTTLYSDTTRHRLGNLLYTPVSYGKTAPKRDAQIVQFFTHNTKPLQPLSVKHIL